MAYRILHIVGGMDKGGTETMLMNIYRKIDKKLVQFDFLYTTTKDTYYDKEILELGGKIIRINSVNKIGIIKSIQQMKKIILDNGPYKAVHAHTLFNSGIAMKAAQKANVNIRISHAHTTADNENGIIRKIYINMMRMLIIKNSTNILACSDLAGKYLFLEKNIRKSKYMIIPNLVSYENIINLDLDTTKFFKKINDIKSNELVIGHIGTFKKSKNQEFILKIVHRLKSDGQKVKLLLVGDGSIKYSLEKMAEELNIKQEVIFMGIRDDIDIILNSMDVFVFPSIFEGLGLVLLEAQAAGLPCIVSEAIQPEADLKLGLFNKLDLSEDIKVWADKIIAVAGEKETDKQKILRAFDKNGYSNQKCISKLLSVYEIYE